MPSDAIDDRAVTLTTTACGHASRTSGAGVIVDDGLVLASAHVVIGAGSIAITSTADGRDLGEVTVAQIDRRTDLALLRVPGARAEPITIGDVDAGDVVSAAGGGPSGPFTATVTRRVEVRIEEVRSAQRSARLGYEIAHRLQLGDSGGGLFDADGALVGIVFGRSDTRDDASFAVRREEIEPILSAGPDTAWICDSTKSRLTQKNS